MHGKCLTYSTISSTLKAIMCEEYSCQGLLTLGRGSYVVPGSAVFKASTLTLVLSLLPKPLFKFFFGVPLPFPP